MVGRNRTLVTLCLGILFASFNSSCTSDANDTGNPPTPDASTDDASTPAPGALNWTSRASLTGADFRAIWGSGSDIFAAGNGDVIAHSGDSGMTWESIATGLQVADGWPQLRHIAGSGPTDVWIVGDSSDMATVLLHSTDHGQSWQSVPVIGSRQLESVWATDTMHVRVADHDGDVFSSTDGGATWTQVSLGADVNLFGLWGVGDQEVYAVGARGDKGAMFHSPTAGQTWDEINVAPTGPLWNVWGTPDGRKVYAAGAAASLAWTADHAMTWTARREVGASPAYDLADVWVAPGDGALFIATPSGLVVDVEYKDTGSVQMTYESMPAGDDGSQSVAAVWGRGSGDAWAVGPGGTLRHRE
jgi:photosystem II stability/assembly factor-like uncharacterized protein